MYIGWRRALIIAVCLAAGGMLFAWSGLFNISASSGHWAITDWFLHWTMRNSVRTHSMGIEAPSLEDPALLPPAAGHFASGCAPCHGTPGEPRSSVVKAMTPHPPDLAPRIEQWSNEELFWIVNHGVKFTGMPAWPARHREDEVWAMVAFLRKLPGMSPERYRELAFGNTEASPALTDATRSFEDALDDCARCHERDGSGRGSLIPVIAGQNEAYLAASLEAYAHGKRRSGIMQKAAGDAEPGLWERLAAHYARQEPPSPGTGKADDGLIDGGRRIAHEGNPTAGVPACLACHGRREASRIFPSLEGQHASYLETQLHLFKAGHRGGTAYAHIMQTIAKRMSAEEIRGVAAYFASGLE